MYCIEIYDSSVNNCVDIAYIHLLCSARFFAFLVCVFWDRNRETFNIDDLCTFPE